MLKSTAFHQRVTQKFPLADLHIKDFINSDMYSEKKMCGVFLQHVKHCSSIQQKDTTKGMNRNMAPYYPQFYTNTIQYSILILYYCR